MRPHVMKKRVSPDCSVTLTATMSSTTRAFHTGPEPIGCGLRGSTQHWSGGDRRCVMTLSVEAKARIAELWAAGAPAWQIREEAGVSRHAVLRQVRRLRRRVEPERERSPLRLSLAEREEISRGLAAGESLRAIGRRLGRAPSTISREVSRNGGRQRYRACPAERAMTRHGEAPQACQAGNV